MAYRLVYLWLLGALAFWPLASWRARSLPPPGQLDPALHQEPRQLSTDRAPFTVRIEGITYTVQPQFSYALAGLVVSEHVTEAWWRPVTFHTRANDRLNVKDLCVIWGENAVSGSYRRARFHSGEFTCHVRFPSAPAARAFVPHALSNNHLLAVDPELRRQLRALRRGDQIALRGYLAGYGHGKGYWRGTSISRDDTGNGACETLFVTDLQLLRTANPGWRLACRLAPLGLLAGVLAWLRLPVPQR
ncbi:MAG: hypothetical protein AB1Z22_11230 [Synechococcaceae cyanobacterium]